MIRNFLSILLAVFTLNAFAAVDANQATRADLESVKGIGPGLSAKIVDARKTGSFKDWADLVAVDTARWLGSVAPPACVPSSPGRRDRPAHVLPK